MVLTGFGPRGTTFVREPGHGKGILETNLILRPCACGKNDVSPGRCESNEHQQKAAERAAGGRLFCEAPKTLLMDVTEFDQRLTGPAQKSIGRADVLGSDLIN